MLSRDPAGGVRFKFDALYRNIPIYSQGDLVTGGAGKDWRLGLAKYIGGAPMQRFDRVRAQALADYFSDRT